MTTKIDFINKAYSMGRISGLTASPTPEDIVLALNRLESMAAEWAEQNLCTGYTFEDTPAVNTPHNVPRKYWTAFETSLMTRLLADFGKEPSSALMSMAMTSFSRMSGSLSINRPSTHSSRMPIGSGNRNGLFRKFFTSVDTAPTECATAYMSVGDANNFYEDFSAYLNSNETLASAVITSDDGVTISYVPVLSPGSTEAYVANTAFTYSIGGVTYSKAAVPVGTSPGTDVVPEDTFGAVGYNINAAGSLSLSRSPANATGYASAALAAAAIPSVDASVWYRIGYVTARNSSTAFTFGTTSFNASGTTVAFSDDVNLSIVDSRVNYTVTATGGTDDYKALYQVVIVATTSTGRVITRLKNFELTEVEI